MSEGSNVVVLYSAEDTLNRMREIVANEKLVHMQYVSDKRDQAAWEAGAVCGGLKACAVGSLFLAHGVQATHYPGFPGGTGYWNLPEAMTSSRETFMAARPELRRAYDALEVAAREKIKSLKPHHNEDQLQDWIENEEETLCVGGDLEVLFESSLASDEPFEGMLGVIDRAKEILAAT